MDSLFFITVILLGFFATVICVVAITYRQTDIAILALRILGRLSKTAEPKDEKPDRP